VKPVGVEHDAFAMFAEDVKEHRLIVRLDQGLHRHLVFEQREHSWNNRFELITAPGSLTITGDRGSHTFRRQMDMFEFFRGNPDRPHRINVSYWAEKLPDAGRSVQVYSEDVVKGLLDEHLRTAIAERDAIQREFDEENERQRDEWREGLRFDGVIDENDPDWAPFEPERVEDWPELAKAIKLVDDAQREIDDYDLGYEDSARSLLRELDRIGLVSDTWEWDLSDWDFHFVWCLNAIAWGIQQYDRAVRDGLHVVRTGPIAWDDPLPTTAPVQPEPVKEAESKPVRFEVTMGTARRPAPNMVTVEPTGGVL
jgi:hypothetical protein